MLPIGGPLTQAGVPTDGVFQKITATIVGVITQAGNATVTLTAAGMTGSPIALNVAVANNDDQDVVAGKIRTALAANAVIAAFFTVSGATDKVVLTRTVSAANDATMNLAYTNGTCLGLTPDATSDATTAGVLGDWHGVDTGQYCVDTTNKRIYQNTGTSVRPVWTIV